jgi:hypothetical protein
MATIVVMTKPTRTVLEFASEVLGIDLSPKQAEALDAMSRCPLVVLACGRPSGKSLEAAIWAAYDATMRDLSQHLRPGEVWYVVVVAAGLSQARALFRTVRALFERPMLESLVVGESGDELHLLTNVILKVVPCNSRTVRGLGISSVIFEELAHYIDSEGFQSGEAVYSALAPSTAQFGPEGRVIGISTPRGQRGVFWRLFQQAEQRQDAYALNIPTWEMHPAITEESLRSTRDLDPVMFAQEYEASFLAGGDEFIPLHMLMAATGIPDHEHGQRTLALDPAFSQDDFGLAIACSPADDSTQCYLEFTKVLKKPGFEMAMDEVAGLAKSEGVHRIVTDQFSSQAIVEALEHRGLAVWQVPWTGRSAKGQSKHHRYGQVKALLAQGELALIDDAALRMELSSFSVTPAAVDPGYRVIPKGPDDRADAAVLAITEVMNGSAPRIRWI